MHPVLRKGPLFYKKHPPPFSTFSHKKTFYTFFYKKRPISTFLQKHSSISFPAYGPEPNWPKQVDPVTSSVFVMGTVQRVSVAT